MNIKNLKNPIMTVITITTLLLATGCSATPENKAANDSNELQLFATSGYIGDALSNIAPDAKVITLVGPGGDPHTYQPTTTDIETMRASDLVVHNGLHLEAQMTKPLHSLGEKQLELGTKIDSEKLIPVTDEGEGQYDPHVWNDPELWASLMPEIAAKLGEIRPQKAAEYQANAAAYQQEILAAHEQAKKLLSEVKYPRILVTGHDAFSYFGRTYDLEVLATDYISTEASLSVTQMDQLAEKIAASKIPTIFMDSQANPQAINSLKQAVAAKGWQVSISDSELYADTLSADDTANTYKKALLHNAQEIATALS